ncbi:uncharacterized protein TRIADDRAFT_58988 [Trichoplax adhaerens]|uniref:AB hydrolase-1 domain-containing protein n=1 Tax=Trichoplax adhaerens TaxID=10228 RepID=B3S481_TRIAD|nr:hypothetical protein TRIADDRAFT_58988 [Trichoplax adhaerens]EDV22599.1 hypothetical protein TRIADDRAFT_58988 [Trichoplax adhaerens]|eukprot:XP_002115143.1 hypothetical protein TRIADDRAFT_58988 [Trichoplax adhaerens]
MTLQLVSVGYFYKLIEHLIAFARQRFKISNIQLVVVVPAIAKPEYGKHGIAYTSKLAVHYVASGTPGKPLILFIHGFPEFWFSWRAQLKEFGNDYYAVAMDNRGYGDTTIPSLKSKDYCIDLLAQDVKEVVEALGYDTCTLVGHDWGGAIAWHTAISYPEYFNNLIVMNGPHPKYGRLHMYFWSDMYCLEFEQKAN